MQIILRGSWRIVPFDITITAQSIFRYQHSQIQPRRSGECGCQMVRLEYLLPMEKNSSAEPFLGFLFGRSLVARNMK